MAGRRSRTSKRAAEPARANAWERIWHYVRRVPRGRVVTYGQVARAIGGLSPRAVGWAMNACPDDVPWHRVVNARGGFSTERLPGTPQGMQRTLLQSEGVRLRPDGTLDLARYAFKPGGS